MTWKGRLRKVKEKPKQLDFEALRIPPVAEKFDKVLQQRVDNRVNVRDSLESKYATMVKDVSDTIVEVVPEKERRRGKVRERSEKTIQLFEDRARECSKLEERSDTWWETKKSFTKAITRSCRDDYREYIFGLIDEAVVAAEKNDSKKVSQLVNRIAGTSASFSSIQPTKNESGEVFGSTEELLESWKEFAAKKFKPTQAEADRGEMPPLVDCDECGSRATIPRPTDEELELCMKALGRCKAVGKDGIPIEVFDASVVAQAELFGLVKDYWAKEDVPSDAVIGVFVTIFKNKGSSENFSKYRFICLLNHAFKLMSCYLLLKFMPLAECLQPETQAGFRKHRSTRDNIFLLSELMDEVIRTGNGCVLTFIDFVSAFDTVSHHFLDESMGEIEAELIEQNRLQEVLRLRKCRAMFRAIYAKASACVRVTDSAGQRMCSDMFPVDRGVVQGDIFSPVAFILALAVVMMRHGKRRGVQNTISSSASNEGGGNTDEDGDSMPELHSDSGDEGSSDRESNGPERTLFQLIEELEYADDAAFADKTAREASERMSRLAAGALKDADMEISVPKTEAMHVRDQPAVSPVRRADYTDKELAKLLKHKCEYCGDGFDTKQGQNQHVTSCGLASRAVHEQDFEVEAVLDARGPPEHRFYKVLWKGWAESDDYWEPWRHLLNSADATDKFWANSGLDKESCIEAAGESRCKW
jgi:hypothetical protein